MPWRFEYVDRLLYLLWFASVAAVPPAEESLCGACSARLCSLLTPSACFKSSELLTVADELPVDAIRSLKALVCRCCLGCERGLYEQCGEGKGYCKPSLGCRSPAGVTTKLCLESTGMLPLNASSTLPCFDQQRRYFVPSGTVWESDCVRFACTSLGSIRSTPFQCDRDVCSKQEYRETICCKYCSPVITVTCGPTWFEVAVKKPVIGYQVSELSLSNTSCKASENSSHVTFKTVANSCGTRVKILGENVVMTNNIVAFRRSGVIARRIRAWLVACAYPRQVRAATSYFVTTSGRKRTSDEFLLRFTTRKGGVLPTTDLSESIIDGHVYVAITSGRTYGREGRKLMLQTCGLSKNTNGTLERRVSLIENGCPAKPGVQILQRQSSYVRFSFPVEQTKKDRPAYDLSCRLIVCSKGDARAQCNLTCKDSTA